jgi:hypothetical protein
MGHLLSSESPARLAVTIAEGFPRLSQIRPLPPPKGKLLRGNGTMSAAAIGGPTGVFQNGGIASKNVN